MTDTKATPATDEQVAAWIALGADGRLFIPAHIIDSLVARINSDAEIIKAREAAYDTAQEGLKNARKQESEMRETIRKQAEEIARLKGALEIMEAALAATESKG